MKEHRRTTVTKTTRRTLTWTEKELREALGIPEDATVWLNFGAGAELFPDRRGNLTLECLQHMTADVEEHEVLEEKEEDA